MAYYFRHKSKGGNSIEEIFLGIQRSLKQKEIEVFTHFGGVSNHLLKLIFKRNTVHHITGDVLYLAFFLFVKPLVITIHDIGRYKELKGIKKFIYGWIWLKGPMVLAKKTTIVSDYTRKDIIQHFGNYYDKKLVVIHNPLPPIFERRSKELLKKNESLPFTILHIGTGIHKNLPTLIKALQDSDYKLIIIGNLNSDQQLLLDQSNISFEHFSNLTYEEVLEQYTRADLLSFVSLHEGFGMPIIEAQALGIPVLTSKVCSLPEVGLDSVVYVDDPMSHVEIREHIDKLHTNKSFTNEIILKGKENIKRFEFEKIVDQYLDLYQKIV